jgi:hypothetical protein
MANHMITKSVQETAIDLWIFIISILSQIFPALFKPEFVVSGVAMAEDGTPLAGVALTLGAANAVSAVSGDDGSFAFQAVKSGEYALYGFKDNGDGSHYEGSITVTVTGNMVQNLTLA